MLLFYLHRMIDTIIQSSSCRLVKGMLYANISIVLLVSFIDLHTRNMTYEVWYISVVFVTMLIVSYLVTIYNGRWHDRKRRMENTRVISVTMLLLIVSGSLSFYKNVFLGMVGVQAYLEFVGITVLMILVTSLPKMVGIKEEIFRRSQNVLLPDKVRHISQLIGKMSYCMAVGIIVIRVILYMVQGKMVFESVADWISCFQYMVNSLLFALVILICAIGIQRELKKGLKIYSNKEKEHKFGCVK